MPLISFPVSLGYGLCVSTGNLCFVWKPQFLPFSGSTFPLRQSLTEESREEIILKERRLSMGEYGEFRPAFASLPVIVIYTLSSPHSNVIPDYQPTATQTAFHA